MTLYVFLLPLSALPHFLVRLCYLYWLHHWPVRSAASARRTSIRHLLTLVIFGYGRGPRRLCPDGTVGTTSNQKFIPLVSLLMTSQMEKSDW